MQGIAGSTAYAFDSDVDYFGTIRARVGYTWDRLMIYGTGGAVYGKNSSSGVIGGVAFDNSETYWTWTLGAGVEYAFADNWSIKGEYLYIGTPSDIATAYGTTSIDGDINTNVVRVGVNYRF
jgi:outer membrane immunogenic protein